MTGASVPRSSLSVRLVHAFVHVMCTRVCSCAAPYMSKPFQLLAGYSLCHAWVMLDPEAVSMETTVRE